MINTLRLTNFMKHESLELAFDSGLVVVRGANESGKSSVLLAIAYLFFGSKGLRTTFGQAVHHGKPESSLRVEASLTLAGKTLDVRRSKGGAEIAEGGKITVTGQTEVTTYLSNLLGADAASSAKLMMASQGNLRGALEAGPKATSEMIEGLADMDLIERLLEAMTNDLMLGNTSVIESQLANATATLEATPVPVRPDFEGMAATLAANQVNLTVMEADSARLFKALNDADQAWKVSDNLLQAKKTWTQRIAEEVANLGSLERQASALKVESRMPTFDTGGQRLLIQQATDYATVVATYERFQALRYPVDYWEGSREDFDEAWELCNSGREQANQIIVKLQGEIQVLAQTRVNASICGFCGQDFSTLPEIAKKNAETDKLIQQAEEGLASWQHSAKRYAVDCAGYAAVAAAAKAFQAQVVKLQPFVAADEGFWPHKVTWIGNPPGSAPDIAQLRADLAAMEQAIKQAEAATAKVQVVQQMITQSKARLEGFQAQLTELADVTEAGVAEFELARQAAHQTWLDANENLSRATLALSTLRQESEQLAKDYAAATRTREEAEKVQAQAAATLETMRFNNALQKKVRAARPLIADKLWALVLASVSTYFSRMRGEPSVVAKGKDGFTVNGQAVETLSGSTLDLLGLALRVALTRTFIPHTPFLVLDEPFASCDSERALSMLAFIKSAGFTQTLLVTHDEISETVADRLVEL
jgi:DNA repair exonuclease SbcCD ATPase subunit